MMDLICFINTWYFDLIFADSKLTDNRHQAAFIRFDYILTFDLFKMPTDFYE